MDVPSPGNNNQRNLFDLLRPPLFEYALVDALNETCERVLADLQKNEVILTPGNGGVNCLGNGEHCGPDGTLIGVQCDECDYQICCYDSGMCDKCLEENGVCEIAHEL